MSGCRLGRVADRGPFDDYRLENKIVPLLPESIVFESRAIKHTLVWSQHKTTLSLLTSGRTFDTPTVTAHNDAPTVRVPGPSSSMTTASSTSSPGGDPVAGRRCEGPQNGQHTARRGWSDCREGVSYAEELR
jgi:hypothetical protein